MERDTLSAFATIARSKTVAVIGTILVAAATTLWTWAASRPTMEQIGAQLNEHDHGHPAPLPLRDGRKQASHQDLVDELTKLRARAAATEKQLDAVRKQVIEAYAMIVRMKAADLEPRRALKADAASQAVDRFRSEIADGDAPDEAARKALRHAPPR